jgi:hypothetical protein
VPHDSKFETIPDRHAWERSYGDSLAAGNESLYQQASWIQSWVALLKSVLENTPGAHGKLLIDLINEPDG